MALVAVLAIAAHASCASSRRPEHGRLERRARSLEALGLVRAPDGARGTTVEVPSAATGELRVADVTGAVRVAASVEGASEVAAEERDGLTVYPGAVHGADLVRARLDDGVEDFVFFDAPPAREELAYRLDVSSVAGLRLVEDTLELLDASGAPRLRVAPPFVVARDGARHRARLSVEGCAVDVAAAPPWGRPVTPPGARTCTLRVSWRGVAYPAIVDPAWSGTASLVTARHGHAMTTLPSGKLLVVGGYYQPLIGMGTGPVDTVEVFDPETGTWALGGGLRGSREDFALAPLPSGRILISGGGGHGDGRPQYFDPATGVGLFENASLVPQGRGMTATALANGKVLLLGGFSGAPTTTAALLDEAADAFTPAGALPVARAYHTATRLASGKVLVAGGDGPLGPLATAVLYDPETNGFTPTAGPMTSARSRHVAALLADGRVLVAGGGVASAEVYDPVTDRFAPAGELSSARSSAQAIVLASGKVMVAGGSVGGVSVGTVEIWDPATMTFAPQTPLSFPRRSFGAVLAGDAVVVTGGFANGGTVFANELWRPGASGSSCRAADDCASGVCDDGICCAGPCGGACQTCLPTTGACVAVTGADDPNSCTGATTCDAAGACKKKNGQACAAAAECASGACVDGFCCVSACAGQCEACDVPGHEGQCIPVVGDSHGERPRCDGFGTTCGGACDGVRGAACAFPSAATTCASSCEGDQLTASTCDGRGACVAESPQSCPGNFVCADATSCKTTCETDADCTSGYRCEPSGELFGRCAPITLCEDHLVRTGKDDVTDCSPYTCEQSGICRTTCGSVADCVAPTVCSEDGRCVEPPAPLVVGCAVAQGESADAGPWAAAAIATLAAGVARRKRSGRGRADARRRTWRA